jgi:MtrB/PioB family decaheme-associated outer membrane protein
MKKAIFVIAVLLAAAGTARAQQAPAVTVSGSVTTGAQQVDSNTNSSKLTEYRDLRDGFFAPRIRLDMYDTRDGSFFDLGAANVSRADQSLSAAFGVVNEWDVRIGWNQVPHNFSDRAQTPYIQRSAGLFEVPATVPITFKKLATAAADAPGVRASDDLIAAFQSTFLRPTDVAVKNHFGSVAFRYGGVGITYNTIRKDGLKAAYAPIGDRPPRTLNVQLTEPVDYRTNEVTVTGEHAGSRYLAQFEYLFSDFANSVDTLIWQNVYATAQPGATYDVWDRAVSTFGRRPLPPDSRYHHISAGIAGDLPKESRLSARVSYGRMTQDETLLPYSYNADLLAVRDLPRGSADADIATTQVLVDYAVNPTARLNVRAWARYFGLDNNTAQSTWNYVTSDTSNLNGTVSYKNRRVNLAYATDRAVAGLDATWRLPARSSLSAGYEREGLSRDFREADTTEDRLTLALKTRAARWANVRARYVFGNRSADEYDYNVTAQSYWYSSGDQGTDQDNPKFTFSNHPDMRRYDVIDRRRNQVDLTVTLTPRDTVTLSGAVRWRDDDFGTDVRSIQPLAVTGFGEVNASTPGQQLGLLESSRVRYSLDAFCMPSPRVTLNAFVSRDTGGSLQRGLEFNENNKGNPGAVATAELGPWTRASSQWTADFDDKTWTGGAGATIQLVPDRASLSISYTASLGDVDIEYAGYGVTNWDATPYPPNHQFYFAPSPPAIREDLHVFDLKFDVPIVQRTTLSFGYTYERYVLDDWQQNVPQEWVETVGSEFLLRDSSRSHQWGNRLFNLGTPLAPDFRAHIGWAALAVRF